MPFGRHPSSDNSVGEDFTGYWEICHLPPFTGFSQAIQDRRPLHVLLLEDVSRLDPSPEPSARIPSRSIGGCITSKDSMMCALVKIASYCDFRAKTEIAALEARNADLIQNLPLQLEQGYAAFLSSYVETTNRGNTEIPHPFDTHPTLKQRITHLGFEADAALRNAEFEHKLLTARGTEPLRPESDRAPPWLERQEHVKAYHQENLAGSDSLQTMKRLRLSRSNFLVPFSLTKREPRSLDYDRIQFPEWTTNSLQGHHDRYDGGRMDEATPTAFRRASSQACRSTRGVIPSATSGREQG